LAVCPQCEAEEEKDILQVSRYIKDNPNSTLMEVSDALEIYIEDIQRWIDERRLSVSVHSIAHRECALCGTAIQTGRICPQCSNRLDLAPHERREEPKPARPRSDSGGDRWGSTGSGATKYQRR
jgi:ribosomal protein L32